MNDNPMQTALLYFFSANAQVFGGLIAILGVFVVYALQHIQSSIEWSRGDLSRAMEKLGTILGHLSLNTQMEVARKSLEAMRQQKREGREVNEAQHAIDTIEAQRKRREEITAKFKRLFLLKAAILSASSLCILLVPLYPDFGKSLIGTAVLVLMASLFSLVLMGCFIKKTLERYKKEELA